MSVQSEGQIRRGDIWMLNFDPVVGHEQGGHRPGLILSSDLLHSIPSQLVIVVPLSTRDRQVISHVPIDPPEGGLSRRSFVITEQPQTMSRARLDRPLGSVSVETMEDVMKRVRWFLDL